MKILLEVFRNTPPGKACQTLSANVLEVVSSNLDKDMEVRLLPFPSPEADERGVEIAPCLVINGRKVIEGMPSSEEIADLIEEAWPQALGVVLTKAPHEGEAAQASLDLLLEALAVGDRAGLFLLSDGVWVAKRGQGTLEEKLKEVIKGGGEIILSGEHLKAGGLAPEQLIEGTSVAPDPYDRLVDLVMDEWDRVIVF